MKNPPIWYIGILPFFSSQVNTFEKKDAHFVSKMGILGYFL